LNFAGTVSGGPKLTMSGTRWKRQQVRHGAPPLPGASGRPLKTPPTNSSAHSVSGDVENSGYHSGFYERFQGASARAHGGKNDDFESFGLEQLSRAINARCGIPKLTATMVGLPDAAGGSVSTIPQIAPAARARSNREMRFSPATSTMLGNMTMSLLDVRSSICRSRALRP